MISCLCGLGVDGDKVVADDEDHRDAAEAVGKGCELVVVYHLEKRVMRQNAMSSWR